MPKDPFGTRARSGWQSAYVISLLAFRVSRIGGKPHTKLLLLLSLAYLLLDNTLNSVRVLPPAQPKKNSKLYSLLPSGTSKQTAGRAPLGRVVLANLPVGGKAPAVCYFTLCRLGLLLSDFPRGRNTHIILLLSVYWPLRGTLLHDFPSFLFFQDCFLITSSSRSL